MSCEGGLRSPSDLWAHRKTYLDVWGNPAFWSTRLQLSDSGNLVYCEACLVWAQAALTQLLGEDDTELLLDTNVKALTGFGIQNRHPSANKKYFWNLDHQRTITRSR